MVGGRGLGDRQRARRRVGVGQRNPLRLRHGRNLGRGLPQQRARPVVPRQEAVGYAQQRRERVDGGVDGQLAPHQPRRVVHQVGFQPGLLEEGGQVGQPFGRFRRARQVGGAMAGVARDARRHEHRPLRGAAQRRAPRTEHGR
jgi:hypothetical protein